MKTLSKTICLGVIILALQVLRGLKFPRCLRIVSFAARALGVSRKSGYEAAHRIRKLLERLQDEEPEHGEEFRQEALKARIRMQVLTFERDHPGVRFGDRHAHLPPEGRALCVRLIRDFKDQISFSAIAACLGVPLPSLHRWDSEAGPDGRFPEKPERRGIHRRTGPEDIDRVIAEFRALAASITLEEFAQAFNQNHPDHPLDRRTITRILQSNGLQDIETRDQTPSYHPPFKVFYPGAQVAIDGHHTQVVFKSDPRRPIDHNKEVGIDIASCAILGDAVGKTEDTEGVQRVLVQVREEYESVIAVIADNGSANRAVDAQAIFRSEEDPRIFSFPRHPWTNGYVEGLFGQFSRIVGKIEIDDTSKETIAASIVEVIWRVFIHFHNYAPRARLGGRSPLDYFRSYTPLPAEVEEARKELRKQRAKSRESREVHQPDDNPELRAVVKTAIERNRLPIPLDKAVASLRPFDLQVIVSASDAFFAYSKRPHFEEKKRNFPYFYKIVSNKQEELNAGRRKSHHLEIETARKLAEYRDDHQVVERERRMEEEDFRTMPEKVVLRYCDLLLRGSLELLRGRCLNGIQRGLEGLRRQGRATKAMMETLSTTIRSWGRFKESMKEELVKLLFEEGERAWTGMT